MTPLAINAFTMTNALGRGIGASRRALAERSGGLSRSEFYGRFADSWLGRVAGVEDERLPAHLDAFDCRNNRLCEMALVEDDFLERVRLARTRYGASRVGVFLGTSTSGSLETELAFGSREDASAPLPPGFSYEHTLSAASCVTYLRRRLELSGPAAVVTTACSSSAKVFATASRYVRAGLCDAAVVGGVDSLCLSTLYGFHSLGVVSDDVCRPWDVDRRGMNVGEGAGFALLEPAASGDGALALLGYGESSDAHHMASPHPEGEGAVAAMEQALESAGLRPDAIDYINLHGTGTRANDESEDRAVLRVFGDATPCSSTKGWTGHALGAAGVIEALFTLVSIDTGLMPGTLNTERVDPNLSIRLLTENREGRIDRALSNSFGFGGTNCALVFGRV